MDKTHIISKTRNKVLTIMLVYLCIALVLIGLAVLPELNRKNELGEALDLHTLVKNNSQEAGQYVKIEIDTPPVMMLSSRAEDNQLYFATDVNDHIYIVNMSQDTEELIRKTYNNSTGKLDSIYELTGVIQDLDDGTRNISIGNGYRAIKSTTLTADNFSDFLDDFYLKNDLANARTVEGAKILALAGFLFLILAFGYGLPRIITVSKGDLGIYEEERMRKTLEKYVPMGETLQTAVYAVGQGIYTTTIFGNCIYDNKDQLMPCAENTLLEVKKNKVSTCDIYVGITEHYLIICECEPCKHYYEFHPLNSAEGMKVAEVTTPILLKDIGHCISLADVKKRLTRRTLVGATKCTFILKNDNTIDFLIPKATLIYMPNHKDSHGQLVKRFYSI